MTLWAPQGQRWAELNLDEADSQDVQQFQELAERELGLVEEILVLAGTRR